MAAQDETKSSSSSDSEADGTGEVRTRRSSKRTRLGFSEQVRTHDEDGFKLRAGTVCVRRRRHASAGADSKGGDADGGASAASPASPAKDDGDGWEALLISSSNAKHAGKLTLPGGGIEVGESPREAAVRETEEEAGAVGRLGAFVGVFEDAGKDGRRARTSVWVLHVNRELGTWEEGLKGRTRRWLPVADAVDALAYKPKHQRVLRAAIPLLGAKAEAAAAAAETEAT